MRPQLSNRRSFLSPVFARSILLAGLSLLAACAQRPASPDDALPRSTPEAQGISSARITAFLEAVDARRSEPGSGVHSVMVVRNGHVVAEGWWEPYEPDLKHMLCRPSCRS